MATYCSRSVTTPTLSLNSPVRGSEAQARNIFHDDNDAWMDLNIPNYDIILWFWKYQQSKVRGASSIVLKIPTSLFGLPTSLWQIQSNRTLKSNSCNDCCVVIWNIIMQLGQHKMAENKRRGSETAATVPRNSAFGSILLALLLRAAPLLLDIVNLANGI